MWIVSVHLYSVSTVQYCSVDCCVCSTTTYEDYVAIEQVEREAEQVALLRVQRKSARQRDEA